VIGAGLFLRTFNWDTLRDEITFGCNVHVMHMPIVPTYFMAMDWNPKIAWIYEAYRQFDMIRFIDDRYIKHVKDFIPVKRLKRPLGPLFTDEGIGYCNYTAVAMTEIALFMDARRVILIGVCDHLGAYKFYWNTQKYNMDDQGHYYETCLKPQIQQFKKISESTDRVFVMGDKQNHLIQNNIFKSVGVI
jgi:hypothetical protein